MRALSGDFQPWVDFFAFISAEEFFITGVNQIDLSGRKFKEKQTIALGGGFGDGIRPSNGMF